MSTLPQVPGEGPKTQAEAVLFTTQEMGALIDTICAQLKSTKFIDKEISGIHLALEEAIVNSIKHGHQYDVTKKVHVTYSLSERRFQAEITDEGEGFDSEQVPDPLAEENVERPCGRGVFLIRHYMSSVLYNKKGNKVMMMKETSTIDVEKGED